MDVPVHAFALMLMIVLLSFVVPLYYFEAMERGRRNEEASSASIALGPNAIAAQSIVGADFSVPAVDVKVSSAGEAVLRIGDHVYLKLFSEGD